MNKSNTTNGTQESDFLETWDVAFTAVDVLIITLIVLTVWLLLSFIIYGTRTNRWRHKPGNSSLSSGMSYVLCTIAIVATIPLLATIELINLYPEMSVEEDLCKTIADGQATAYFVSVYVTYLFIWFMHRRIYKHPYVKNRVKKWMDIFSVVFVIALSITFAFLVVIYNYFGKYKSVDGVCVFDSTREEKLIINLSGAAVVVTLQILLMWILMYTAVRARFPSADNKQGETASTSTDNNWKIFYQWFFPKDSKMYFGPVEKTVRRIIASSLTIMLTDMVSVLMDVAILPIHFPLSIHLVGYSISNMINAFCLVSIFGFSQKVLSYCCPKKSEMLKVRGRAAHVTAT